MTTIVCDRKRMVSDSSGTESDGIVADIQKIFRMDDGSIMGVAGDYENACIFMDWYNNGCKKARPQFRGDPFNNDDDDFTILHLTDEGIFTWGCVCRKTPENKAVWGVGSGRAVAFGAIRAGADLETAIRIAAELDEATREPIQQLSLHERP